MKIRRSISSLCALLLAGLAFATFAMPASASFYSGGMYYAKFTIQPYSYNSTWQGPLNQALANWVATPTCANPYKSSASESSLTATQFADGWYGLYTPHGSGQTRYFTIQLNSRTIAHDATNVGNFITSAFTHELGHALSLADDPATAAATIMSHARNRNTMTKPQTYDINDVNNFYTC
jgi:hypothetical protein